MNGWYGYLLAVAVVQFLLGVGATLYFTRRGGERRSALHVRSLAAKLQSLAMGVADDMGSFRQRLEQSTRRLSDARAKDVGDGSPALTEMVMGVVADVIEEHSALLAKLDAAEKRLSDQANQIQWYLSEARTDALTALANRRAFDEELGRRFAQWQRKKQTLSVMLIDADHFKRINDRYGHATGDAVLKALAQTLHKTFRDMDTVARYGGEEFAVILPDTDTMHGRLASERILRAVENAEFYQHDVRMPVTVSLGLAEVRQGEDVASLVARADAALYAAKHHGRNCGYFHDGVSCIPVLEMRAAVLPVAAAEKRPLGPISIELAEACDDVRAAAREVAGAAGETGG